MGSRRARLAQRVVGQEAHERVAERGLVAAAHEQPGVRDDLGDRAARVAHDRRPRGERLERGEAEPLEERRVEEALGARVERRERRVVDVAGDDHAVPRHARIRERVAERGRELPEVTDDDETQVAIRVGRAGEGAQQAADVLARIELAHVEDVARRNAEALSRQPPPGLA